MNTKIFTLLPFLVTAMLLISCNNNGTTETKKKSLSIKVQLPSNEEAIKHIQTYAARTQQTVLVHSFYYQDVKKKKPCDQYDWDLGRCSGVDAWSKYGYKMVSEKVKKCCRPEAKVVSKITGNWVATYFEPKNEWDVALEYKADSKKEQKVSWSISLSPSNELQVSVGVNEY